MNKKKLLLISCFIATLGVHSAALLVYMQYPHVFQPQQRERLSSHPLAMSWEEEMKNKEIEDAFDQILALAPPERSYERHQLPVETERMPLPEKSQQIGAVDFLVTGHEEFQSNSDISVPEDNVYLNDIYAQRASVAVVPTLQKSASFQVAQEIHSWGTLFDTQESAIAAVSISPPDAERTAALVLSRTPSSSLAIDNSVSFSPKPFNEDPLSLFDPLQPYTSSLHRTTTTPSPRKEIFPKWSPMR